WLPIRSASKPTLNVHRLLVRCFRICILTRRKASGHWECETSFSYSHSYLGLRALARVEISSSSADAGESPKLRSRADICSPPMIRLQRAKAFVEHGFGPFAPLEALLFDIPSYAPQVAHGFVEGQVRRDLRTAARGQVGFEKHFGSPVQRADGAKFFQPLPLEANDESSDLVRRVGDVTYAPLNDARTP